MQRFNFVAATILGTSLSIGLAAAMPAAHAMSLIPQQEGEIDLTNMNCIVEAKDCIQTEPMGFTVTSQAFDSQFGLSRLFVDRNATENTWGPQGTIKFTFKDEGTNPISQEYWYRPVAYLANGTVVEDGRLEVGRFLFDLQKAYSAVELNFYDVEDNYFSGVLEVNGTEVSNLLPGQGKEDNSSTKTLVLNNVSSFVVQMGNPGTAFGNNSSIFTTGDGVRLSGLAAKTAIPEPTTTLGLGLMTVAGLFGLSRKKLSKVG
ncbi:hypothetical protein NUACC21_10620 [Scytonema sp. NUACC21]